MWKAIELPVCCAIGLGIGSLLPDADEKAPSAGLPDNQETLIAFGVLTATVAAATYYTKYYSTAWRFNKVVKGDWVITDEPPQQTQDVKLKDLVESYLPKPVPEPV